MWYQFHVEDRARGIGRLNEIFEDYQARGIEDRLPQDFAVFCRETNGKSATFYFAPGAGLLAAECGALACEPPGIDGLELLTGSDAVWATFADAPAPPSKPLPPAPVRLPAQRVGYWRY